MRVLMVVTSHDKLGDSGNTTGFWLEELAAPYYRFVDAGAQVTLASPEGGRPPIDPNSLGDDAQTEDTRRFQADTTAQARLNNTMRLAELNAADYDAIFFPGGHGPLWDLAEDSESIGLTESFVAADKPVGAVCHGPAALMKVKRPDGTPLVKGKRVTGFTDGEETAVGLTEVVPFSIEARYRDLGAIVDNAGDFQPHAVCDGKLVTGQNPASSSTTANELLALLRG